MANPEHLAVVRRGAAAVAEWRRAHANERLDLGGSDLREADLREVNLSGANLSGSDLRQADLREVNLSGASLRRANLSQADLSLVDLSGARLWGADLRGANLWRGDLSGASLRLADLRGANLTGADLSGADLSRSRLGNTPLAGINMSPVAGLATVRHAMPSQVGVDTLIASYRGAGDRLRPDLVTFFRGAGVPQELLEALPRALAEVKYYTCFIAYGQPDLEFAKKLCVDLEAKGVSCWLYDMDATPGEPTWREIGQRRREAEKMVVLCSAGALVRPGVLKEIEEQIDEDPDKMVPISLDDLWKQEGFRVMRGSRDLKPWLLDRNYADFANLPYEEAMERLLKGLRRRDASGPGR